MVRLGNGVKNDQVTTCNSRWGNQAAFMLLQRKAEKASITLW